MSGLCGGFRSLWGPEASLQLLCSLLTPNRIRLLHVSDQISLFTVCLSILESFRVDLHDLLLQLNLITPSQEPSRQPGLDAALQQPMVIKTVWWW